MQTLKFANLTRNLKIVLLFIMSSLWEVLSAPEPKKKMVGLKRNCTTYPILLVVTIYMASC